MSTRTFMKTGISWLAVLCLGASGCTRQAAGESRQGALVGKPAPAFRVQGIYHEPLTLETFKGHILILQFGTSW